MSKAKRKRKEPPFMVIAVDDLKSMLGSKLKGKNVKLSEEQATDLYLMFKEAVIYR